MTAWFFRRIKKNFHDDQLTTQGMIYSPVGGKVVSVREGLTHCHFGEGLTEIRISLPLFSEIGIFLPVTSEVVDVKKRDSTRLFRFATNQLDQVIDSFGGIEIVLRDKVGEQMAMQFIPCYLGRAPEIVLAPGDRGKRQVNIGHFPFGGTVLIYLPQMAQTMVSDNERVKAGETILSSYKVFKKEVHVN